MENNKISIHAYKFNGKLYRTWEFATIIKETDEYLCVSINGSHIITSKDHDKRFFHSELNRPTIWYFFKHKWYNIIVSKKMKFFYYINLASPYIFEDNVIKYIDFDLDYRIPDTNRRQINLLDADEFVEHSIKYKYPQELINKIKLTQKQILDEYNEHRFQRFLDINLMYKYSNKGRK